MQTIRINTRTNASGNVTIFSINGVCVAHVGTDLYNVGRYAGRVNHAGGAVFLTAAIESTAGSQ